MNSPRLWVPVFLAAVGTACLPATATRPLSTPTTVPTPATSQAAMPTETPASAANCYFVWSSEDLPELSQDLDRELEAADPTLSGTAYAYGEDCVAADGTKTFSPMETDFQIQVRVDDLADTERMGNAIGTAMAVLAKLPASQLQGPQPGRAEFEFVTAASDSLRLNVDLASYASKTAGLNGSRLFDALQSAQ